ncbi:hypothetical protein FJZ33_04395 [Candidatus Poribacteria bacterium]|nr:hypothetical protein [Candidatus Poribacteria bacterium]
MLAGLVTVVPTSCVYLWLKDKRFDSQKLLRKPFTKHDGMIPTACVKESISASPFKETQTLV